MHAQLGLTHSGRTYEQQTADRPSGVVQAGFKQSDHLDHGFDRVPLAYDSGPEPVANFSNGPYVLAGNDKPRQARVDGEHLFNECGGHRLVLTDGALLIQVVTDLPCEAQGGPGPGGRGRKWLT